jgi:GntR family transcriptional repressor for pyruvate dehydrogenase complex
MGENERPQKTSVLTARRIIRDASRPGKRSGVLLPPEHQMIETYGVGRSTLREALRLLEFQGAITLKPGPGGGPVLQIPDASHIAGSLMLIMQLTDAPFRILIEARAAIEPMSSMLAAERIDDESMKLLHGTVLRMSEHSADEYEFMSENKKFHDMIAKYSGNAVFAYLIESLSGILDGATLRMEYPVHRRKAVLKAHEEIYAAIEARDPDAARARMEEHISAYAAYAERKYAKLLSEVPEWDTAFGIAR